MISEATYRRGGVDKSITTTVAMHPVQGGTWRLACSASPVITMPDATTLIADKIAFVWNVGSVTLTVKDADGGTIGTVANGAVSLLALFDTSTPAGVWGLHPLAFG